MIVGGWEYVWVCYAIVWAALVSYGGNLIYKSLKMANTKSGAP